MNRVVSATSRFGYTKVAKPILFRFKPDTVHHMIVRAGSFTQGIRPMSQILGAAWSYRNKSMLGQTIAGIAYENPVGLSAGFDKNIQLAPLMKAIGFGFMIGGSVTYRDCAGNPKPWFYRLPKSKSLVVNAGLANHGIEAVADRIEAYPKGVFEAFPLSISVAKTNSREAVSEEAAIDDYAGSVRIIAERKLASMIELNISCPNTYGGEPFTTPYRLEKLLSRIDEMNVSMPVYIKMPQNLPWDEYAKLLDVIINHNIVGVTISNLAKNRQTAVLSDPLPATIPGNLSGKPTQQQSNELIKQTYRNYGDKLIIIGVGGVFTAEDAYEKIRYGSSLVALVTGLIFEGPQMVGSINNGLAKLLRRDGFTNISQAIGVDVRRHDSKNIE